MSGLPEGTGHGFSPRHKGMIKRPMRAIPLPSRQHADSVPALPAATGALSARAWPYEAVRAFQLIKSMQSPGPGVQSLRICRACRRIWSVLAVFGPPNHLSRLWNDLRLSSAQPFFCSRRIGRVYAYKYIPSVLPIQRICGRNGSKTPAKQCGAQCASIQKSGAVSSAPTFPIFLPMRVSARRLLRHHLPSVI